jgi:hypothetical protein
LFAESVRKCSNAPALRRGITAFSSFPAAE